MTLQPQVSLKPEPHLLLAVATSAPGVVFSSRQLHSVGKPGGRNRLGGLQTALNLEHKVRHKLIVHTNGYHNILQWHIPCGLSQNTTPGSQRAVWITIRVMECCLTWPEAFAITQTPSGLLWEPKLKTYVKLVLLTSQNYTVVAVMSPIWFHWIKKLKHE